VLLCSALAGAVRAETDYPLTEDSKPHDGVPQGELLKFTFDHSKIFPSTTREVTVYVPHQYDPATPACVYVGQDGISLSAPAVFDNLIAKKKIPVLIGVFIKPGVMKAAVTNALDRFNHSYEYDGLGPDYARFVLNEIFPAVEKVTTADGRLYVATRMGVQVCDQAGRVECILPTPNGRVENLIFGGENFDTLFCTCGDKVFKR